MKLLIAAVFAAFALVACNEEETAHVKSGNEHMKAASADYTAATTEFAERTYDSVRGAPHDLKDSVRDFAHGAKESAADLADKTANALRK